MTGKASIASPLFAAALIAVAFMAPSAARAADGSLAVCADLGARAGDVVHHCRRALERGGLNKAQEFGAQVNLGEALLTIGQESWAVDAFDAAVALRPDRVEPYVGRANAFEKLGNPRDAARDWATAVRLAPDSLDARIGKGAFHMRSGAPDAALGEFDAAVRIDPEAADARFNRGLAFLATGRNGEAEADFTAVLRDYPSDAGAYLHRGRARSARGDIGAVQDFDRAAELAPEWADPWYFSGRMLDDAGRTEDANRRFRRAFELGMKDPWLLNRITSLGG